MIHPIATPGPCRRCGEPAYLADDEGPVHPCCEIHQATSQDTCPACSRRYIGTVGDGRSGSRERKERAR